MSAKLVYPETTPADWHDGASISQGNPSTFRCAPSNAALVEKAGRIIEVLGDHVATTNDARKILGLHPPPR